MIDVADTDLLPTPTRRPPHVNPLSTHNATLRGRTRRAEALQRARKRYTQAELQSMARRIDEYVEQTEYPLVAEIAYQLGVGKATLYEHHELVDCIKKLTTKAEAYLARTLATDPRRAVGCIFALKQHGWSDARTVDLHHSGEVRHGVVVLPPRVTPEAWGGGGNGSNRGDSAGGSADKSLPHIDVSEAPTA